MTTEIDSDCLDLTPSTDLLVALANANHDHHTVLGELIDNAFDQKATFIEVSYKTGKKNSAVAWRDDGEGCEDPSVMVGLGHKRKTMSTRLGRYGIGAKEAALWLGGSDHEIRIRTIHKSTVRTLSVSWAELKRSNNWKLKNVVSVSPAQEGEIGTYVRVKPLIRRIPEGGARDRLLARIGYMYAPALRAGKSIRLVIDGRAFVVPSWSPPDYAERVDVIVDVDGRKARVVAGIVADGCQNPRPGLTYWHGFRVIMENTSRGCGACDTTKFCGSVELLDGWVLTKNKDNISEKEDELFAAVYAVLAPLLEKAAKASHVLQIEGMRLEATSSLNDMLGRPSNDDSKAARNGSSNEQGSKKPTGKGGRHKKAKNEQSGSTFRGTKVHQGRLDIRFINMGLTAFAATARPEDGVILFNLDHPWIRSVQSNPQAIATHAMNAWAIATALSTQRQLGFGGDADKVYEVFSEIASCPVRLNGESTVIPLRPRVSA